VAIQIIPNNLGEGGRGGEPSLEFLLALKTHILRLLKGNCFESKISL